MKASSEKAKEAELSCRARAEKEAPGRAEQPKNVFAIRFGRLVVEVSCFLFNLFGRLQF